MDFISYMIIVCFSFVVMGIAISVPIYICEKTGISDKIINFMIKLLSEK